MLRALLIKEWTQLRTLRWVGFGLGVAMPAFLVAVAEAAQRGWAPLGTVSSYSLDDLFLQALPMTLIGLWGLLALMIASQAFAGDRGSGTETFLLERPVPRPVVWRARIVASLGSMLLLILAHGMLWGALTQIVTDPVGLGWTPGLGLLGLGVLAALAGLAGGIAAGSLVRNPMHAVLLGLVLAVIPAGAASLLAGLFPLAQLFGTPVGLLLPGLLFVAYFVASFVASCRGEPAGRGRMARAAVVLGVALAAIPVLFLVLAPLALRWRAAATINAVAPSSGPAAVAFGRIGESGWIVDLESGDRSRFLPPPIHEMAWNADGSRLALLHSARGWGAVDRRLRLDVLDPQGSPVVAGLVFDPQEEYVSSLRWAGDRLLARVFHSHQATQLLIASPETGHVARVDLPGKAWHWQSLGPTGDGGYYLRVLVGERPSRVALHRLDLERAEIAPEPLLVEENVLVGYASETISPSGRYYLRMQRETTASAPLRAVLTDLGTGEEILLPGTSHWQWLDGDRLARVLRGDDGTRLVLCRPGEPETLLYRISGRSLHITASPDRRHLLVQSWAMPDGLGTDEPPTPARLREARVYEPESERWIDVRARLESAQLGRGSAAWAGPSTLAVYGDGTWGLLDLDGDDPPRYVVGGE